ncbi:hypothetical protein DQG23_28375 [Paenibacillus contaminans]|uniref:Uncharacterized protein n=1 Tax=Paenibacillus contaminans TaxID=450362 RepID=A0A329MDP8_9BACL|nr:hypothetical protein DQG23_28375 [Paenibacillus contaminans]
MQLVIHSAGLRNAVKHLKKSSASPSSLSSFGLSRMEESAVADSFKQDENNKKPNQAVAKLYWM